MKISNSNIGLFDSGVGGLTVLRHINRILPQESVEYIGDTQFVPYGSKSKEKVRRLSYRLIGYLLGRGSKIIIVACNTATAAILPEAYEDFKVSVVGPIYSGAKAAYEKSRSQKIGLIATKGTIESKVYQKILTDFNPRIQILSQPTPKFVDLVEQGITEGPEVSKTVEQYLETFNNKVDTLILGCTHFPFLRKSIQEYLEERQIQIIDPAESLIQSVKNILVYKGLISDDMHTPEHNFWATDIKKINPEFIDKFKSQEGLNSMCFKQLDL